MTGADSPSLTFSLERCSMKSNTQAQRDFPGQSALPITSVEGFDDCVSSKQFSEIPWSFFK